VDRPRAAVSPFPEMNKVDTCSSAMTASASMPVRARVNRRIVPPEAITPTPSASLRTSATSSEFVTTVRVR